MSQVTTLPFYLVALISQKTAENSLELMKRLDMPIHEKNIENS